MSMYAVSDAHSLVRADSVAPVPAKLPVDPWLIDLKKSADARRLFELEQLDVSWDDPTGALWTFMRPRGRPSYNLDLLEDFHAWQRGIIAAFENRPNDLRFLLLGSRTPGVFNLGGDLDLFAAKIRDRDRQALVAYGESCVRILHRNMNCLGLPMVTIGLAQGDALGGGFESLLSFNVIIAERGAKFGFPENIFGLFPGMGAYSLVGRAGNRLDATRTDALLPQLETGKIYCVHLSRCGRLAPGARLRKRSAGIAVPSCPAAGSMPPGRQFSSLKAHLRKSVAIFAGRHAGVPLEQVPE